MNIKVISDIKKSVIMFYNKISGIVETIELASINKDILKKAESWKKTFLYLI